MQVPIKVRDSVVTYMAETGLDARAVLDVLAAPTHKATLGDNTFTFRRDNYGLAVTVRRDRTRVVVTRVRKIRA